MLTLTDAAKKRVLAGFTQQKDKTALRVVASTNGTSEFSYGMKLVGPEEMKEEDVVVGDNTVQIVLDPKSAEYLNGATIDFEDKIVKSGFQFHNPNKPKIPELGDGPRSDLTGPVAERVQRLIDTELNPAVASHGGMMQFLGIRDNKAYLSFGGGCHGCGMVDVTLKQGVEQRIRELIPEVEEVIDTTDHSAGENPFYT